MKCNEAVLIPLNHGDDNIARLILRFSTLGSGDDVESSDLSVS